MPASPPERVFTVPNAISVARLAGVPLFLWLVLGPQADWWAIAVLIAAGISDWLDGKLARAGWQLDGLDLVEVNEAFAAQAVAVSDELKLDPDRLNVNGGAIAIGHPLGCSGARITTTLLHELRRRGGSRAAASMCIGVGQGIATLWEAAGGGQ